MTHIFEDIIGTFFHIVIFIIFYQIRCNFKHLFLFAFIVRLYKPPRAYKNIIVMENGERTYKKFTGLLREGWGIFDTLCHISTFSDTLKKAK